MTDRGLFIEAGRAVTEANRRVLGKRPNLQAEDARNYITGLVAADRILTRIPMLDIAEASRTLVANGEQSLSEWPANRVKGLLYLLQNVDRSARERRLVTAEAGAACSLALVEEPLITDRNQTEYESIVRTTNIMVDRALSQRSPALSLYNTFRIGVSYNALAFCPQVFPEDEVTPDTVASFRKLFTVFLADLQAPPSQQEH